MRVFLLVSLLLTIMALSVTVTAGAFRAAPQTPNPVLHTKSFMLLRSGEVQLRVRAAAFGCDWGTKGKESAVVSVAVDGKPNQEIVLYRGATENDYDAMLGPLDAGKHELTVTFRPDLSPSGVRAPSIERVSVSLRDQNERERLVWEHAPLLYGRDDNATSDVPIVLFYELRDEGKMWRVVYSLIWSNEDGGTGNSVGSLVARWGRTTDIEWIYDATISKETGEIVKAVIQAAGHQTLPFAGKYRGKHPLLRTSTTNNMVADTGTSKLLFALAPLRAIQPENETRETVMDAFPWTHAIAAKEMEREGKYENPGDATTLAASDIRNYLQIEYKAECRDGAVLAVRVRLKDKQEFFSDHGQPTNAIGRSGWIRTTVELPPYTNYEQISDVSFVRRDKGTGSATISQARAFFLNNEYRPAKSLRVEKNLQPSLPSE
jgi:hypothetical protein